MNDTNNAETPSDVLAHTLLENYRRYAAGNPFKPGDLITPRRGYGLLGAGTPQVVMDVFEVGVDYGSSENWCDMRLMFEHEGQISSSIAESVLFERWTGEVADLGDAP
jgi:hypothetical protein